MHADRKLNWRHRQKSSKRSAFDTAVTTKLLTNNEVTQVSIGSNPPSIYHLSHLPEDTAEDWKTWQALDTQRRIADGCSTACGPSVRIADLCSLFEFRARKFFGRQSLRLCGANYLNEQQVSPILLQERIFSLLMWQNSKSQPSRLHPKPLHREAPTVDEKRITQDKLEVERWARYDQYKARLAAILAGILFWHVRHYSTNGFYESHTLLLATLALWHTAHSRPHSRRSVQKMSWRPTLIPVPIVNQFRSARGRRDTWWNGCINGNKG